MKMFEIAVKRGVVESSFRIVQFAVGFFASGLAIKLLGETVVGTILIYQAEWSFVAAIFGVSIFTNAIIQFVSATSGSPDHALNSRILSTSITVTFLFSAIFSVMALVSITPPFLNFRFDTLRDNVLLISATCVIMAFTSISVLLASFMHASGHYILTSVVDGVGGLIVPIVNGVVVVITRSWKAYMISLSLLALAKALVYAIVAQRKTSFQYRLTIDFAAIKRMPLISFGAYVASLASPISSQADRLVLGTISGASALPAYSIAQTVLNGVNSIIYSASSTFVPLLAREGSQATDTAARLQHIQRWIVSSFALFCYTGVLLFLPEALSVLIGADFGRRATTSVVLACFQGLAMASLVIPIFGLTALKEMRRNAVAEWVNSVGLFGLGLILTLSIGSVGMPVSRLWYFVETVVVGLMYCHVLHIPKSEVFAPIRSSLVFLPIAALLEFAIMSVRDRMSFAVWLLASLGIYLITYGGAFLWDICSRGGREKSDIMKRLFGYVRATLFGRTG